jgi:hypothetical protein
MLLTLNSKLKIKNYQHTKLLMTDIKLFYL